MERVELNWLNKFMEKVRNYQTAIIVLNLVKYSFSLRVTLKFKQRSKHKKLEPDK